MGGVWIKCPYCSEDFELEDEFQRHLAEDHFIKMNKEQVKKALEMLSKALEDKDFKNWLDENYEELTLDYQLYCDGCGEWGREPLGFEEWALRQYIAETP